MRNGQIIFEQWKLLYGIDKNRSMQTHIVWMKQSSLKFEYLS